MPNKVLIIIPTYNERENILNLIEGIFNVLHAADVLVIDDNSPDGTADAVEFLSKDNTRVKLIKREKKLGIGTAYKLGFGYALDNGYEFIFQMDADFSHHPRYLKDLLYAAQTYPVALGSRYVKGGAVRGWNAYRKILSRFGSFYARLLLGLNVYDLTSGYKCFQRRAIEGICAWGLNSEGYVFQVETIFKAAKSGFNIKEVPIIFENRRKGSSKISAKVIIEAAFKIPMMPILKRC